MDMARIDAFPVDKPELVWFNEIEIDAAKKIVDYDYFLKKLKTGYENLEKNIFLDDDAAKNEFNPNCFSDRKVFTSQTSMKSK